MVIALRPGKFYGSSLPRPRFYTDMKFNSERVDPPMSIMDPLMSWAQEAHWNMGGLSSTRHRLQGRIEGNVQKLRTQIEKSEKDRSLISPEKNVVVAYSSPSPPPAPMAVKHRRRLIDDEFEEEVDNTGYKRRMVRKLTDDFDKVATKRSPVKVVAESHEVEDVVGVATRTRSRRNDVEVVVESKRRKLVKKSGENVESMVLVNKPRTSPRLNRSN